MNMLPFSFVGLDLCALPSGAVWWPETGRLLVADLHLGKSERMARRGGALLPPYEGAETLARLERDIAATGAQEVICLGDSFDDPLCAARMHPADHAQLSALQSNRKWLWIAGNHDPRPPGSDGTESLVIGPLRLRHIAEPGTLPDGVGEVSGHFHPKHQIPTRGGRVSRRCVLVTSSRLILPAYGAYTGGLSLSDPAFAPFLADSSQAILLGSPPVAVPLTLREAAE